MRIASPQANANSPGFPNRRYRGGLQPKTMESGNETVRQKNEMPCKTTRAQGTVARMHSVNGELP
jgi:hypothetical protein